MALTYRARAGSWTTTNGTKTVTYTPAVGDFNVVFVGNSGNSGALGTPTLTDDNADGLGTYTAVIGPIARAVAGTDANAEGYVFVRNALIGSATSTIFTMTPGTTLGGGLEISIWTGMLRAGTINGPVRSTGSQATQSASTPAPVFNNTPLTTNACVGFLFGSTSGANWAIEPASWTEKVDTTYATPTSSLHHVIRESGQTSATVTWGGSITAIWASFIVELDATASPTGDTDYVGVIPI